MINASALRTLLVLALAVTSMAAGCGITPTDVMDGGEPAVGFRPSTRLYFVSGARLQAVIRPIPWPPLKETLNLLMGGPNAAERERGLRSELQPSVETPIKVTSGAAKVHISLSLPKPSPMPQPMERPSLPRPALWMGQLTCTAASALAARTNIDPDAVTVVIQQTRGGRLGSFRCSEFPRGSE
jgi:hypothetical protein